MVISSLVVETIPEYTEAVAAKLPGLDGVEVHGIEGCKIVITIERPTVDESHDTANENVGQAHKCGDRYRIRNREAEEHHCQERNQKNENSS